MATLLACDPFALVYSESIPIYSVLFGCKECSEETQIKLLRDIVTIMGQSPYHRRIVFNFQSVITSKMDIVLKAFPITPWAFLFRQPEQLLMSLMHEAPFEASNDHHDTPCLVYMPPEVRDFTNQEASSFAELFVFQLSVSMVGWLVNLLISLTQDSKQFFPISKRVENFRDKAGNIPQDAW